MKILVTGAAGFIGTNISMHFLNKKNTIYGIDNYDDFNSIKLKKFRIKQLKKNKKFYFKKIDITNRNALFNFVKNKKINMIIHMAAQAGVRYSIINPKKYINVNLNGFMNVIFAAKKNNINKIIYASSSSVYGDSKNFPSKETHKLNQKNIYAVTKMLNEKMAETYSKITHIKFVGLRFFTIYGEFGRPDMFLFKLFKSSFTNREFQINNFGNHLRDFTYVRDACEIVFKLSLKKTKKNEVYNVCSNKPENILKISKYFNNKYPVKIKLINKHKADILKTHGDNKKLKKTISFSKFKKIKNQIFKVYNWYKSNKIYKM